MFNIGGGEMVVIGVVALLVVGPEGLPKLFKTGGQMVGRMRAMADDFRRTMESAADEAGAKDLKKQFKEFENDANKMAGRDPLGLNKAGENLRKINGIDEDVPSIDDELAADIEFNKTVQVIDLNEQSPKKPTVSRTKKSTPTKAKT